MSSRYPSANDGRTHNEDVLPQPRMNPSQLQKRSEQLHNTSSTPMEGTPPATYAKATADTAPPSPTRQTQRRQIVFPDPVAFRYLEEDPAVTVVERRGVICGYELYLVEQWACSRESPTLVIATYTGDVKHSVVVGVLSVPIDETAWSPRLRVYFKALQQNHARPKDTPLGELMVTNLSSFPSALTVISVPNGDIRQHRKVFIVNENMKRLGCSGRSGMTLAEPSNATQAKFYQLYKTNERIPFYDSVIELVKLCQVALLIFGKLDHEYIDGLLCDKTEAAVNNWWTEHGSWYYNIEPTDGILGPTTVAALLGMLMGARNRLSWCSAPVAKDVFDIDNTKRGIGAFQKAQKLERTRRLDRQTLLRLHNLTAKAAAGETWGVQKAVKSTVAEIGGKRGEMVIGMVGGRDKGGIGDIETLDIDKFISLATGERAKWLWYGKPRRTGTGADNHDRSAQNMADDPYDGDLTPHKPLGKKALTVPLDMEMEDRRKEQLAGLSSEPPTSSAPSLVESPLSPEKKRTVFKSVAGKMSDARSGLGRIKDAVGGGLRGHVSRPSRDDHLDSAHSGTIISALTPSTGVLVSPAAPMGRAFTWKQKPEEYLAVMKKEKEEGHHHSLGRAMHHNYQEVPSEHPVTTAESPRKSLSFDLRPNPGTASEQRKELISSPPSVAGSVVDEKDLRGPILDQEQGSDPALTSLFRRHSLSDAFPDRQSLNEYRWPRRMSFSDAEEAILDWEDITGLDDLDAEQAYLSVDSGRILHESIVSIKQDIEPWVLSKIKGVEALDYVFGKEQEQLKMLYYQLSEAYQHSKQTSQELVAEQRAQAMESIKDVEVLVARLEYEISALASKVREVEDGVATFEREVESVENRADELKSQLETESWLHWFVRTLTGIGTGPSITRPRPEAPGSREVRKAR